MLKGTVLYEMISLLGYWYNTFSKKAQDQIIKKYCFGSHPQQYFLLMSPLKVDPSKPIILYYHGGGWLFGKPEIFVKKAAIFNKQGYQIIIPSYRKLPRHNYKHMREDLDLTLLKLKELMSQSELDFNKIILGGTSAGGNLVSLLYYQKKNLTKYGFSQSDFPGMFLTAPPLDLSKMKRTPILRLFAGKRSGKIFHDASPINWLTDSEAIKILCMHGTKDGLVNYQASESFLNEFEIKNPSLLKKIKLEDYGHIQSASWAHTDNFLREEIINFIKSCH